MQLWRFILLLKLLLLTACSALRPMTEPMAHTVYAAQSSNEAKTALILMPGIGGQLDDFERYGFIKTAQDQNPGLHIIAVDAHFNYYRSQTIIQRLHQDIIKPLRDKGYCRIEVAGISLGAYGALLYLRRYPQAFDAMYLLAPYLGEYEHYRYLVENTPQPTVDAFSHNIWPWLTSLSVQEKSTIYLAYGEQDKFHQPLKLLENLLPAHASFTIAGKHRWPVWQSLWLQGIRQHGWLAKPTC